MQSPSNRQGASSIRQADLVVEILCPHCNAVLDAHLNRCPQCGRPTASASREPAPRQSLIDRPWVIVLTMLHVGFLGIPLYWHTRYSTRVKLAMIAASILYTIGAVAGIVWGCVYIWRMLHNS
jgi:predicted amidophosphoribosyltransferase